MCIIPVDRIEREETLQPLGTLPDDGNSCHLGLAQGACVSSWPSHVGRERPHAQAIFCQLPRFLFRAHARQRLQTLDTRLLHCTCHLSLLPSIILTVCTLMCAYNFIPQVLPLYLTDLKVVLLSMYPFVYFFFLKVKVAFFPHF